MAGRTEYLNLDDFEAKEDISFNEENDDLPILRLINFCSLI